MYLIVDFFYLFLPTWWEFFFIKMMDIQKLNEQLDKYIEAFQINEMAIYYGTNHGQVKDAVQAAQKLNGTKEGYVTCSTPLIIRQPVTQEEVDAGLYSQIQKDILVDKQIPIIFVWGEPNKIREDKPLEGHGFVHILQGHKKQFGSVINKLKDCMIHKMPARLDKSGNYTIRTGLYRFCFAPQYKNNLLDHVVLISAFKAI